MDSSEQLTAHFQIKLMFGSSRFQAVLHYYSGFNPAIQEFIHTYSQQQSRDRLPLLHCFYEAQQLPLCNLIDPMGLMTSTS